MVVVPQVLSHRRRRLWLVLTIRRGHSPQRLQRQPNHQEQGQATTHDGRILEVQRHPGGSGVLSTFNHTEGSTPTLRWNTRANAVVLP